MKPALLIPAYGEPRAIEVPEEGIDELQRLVGGDIQYVPTEQDVTLFCNEEGKIARLPENRVATRAFGQMLLPSDYFVGDIVVVEGSGPTLDVEAWLSYVKEWSA